MAELATLPLYTDSSLKAYYRMDSANDATGSYNLTNNGSIAFGSGKYGNAANLGSSNSTKYLSTTATVGIDGGSYSVSLWVKLNDEIASGGWYFSSQFNTTSKVGYFILYDYNSGTRRLQFQRLVQNVTANNAFTTVTLGTTDWHHLVLTYDGATLKGYLDNGNPTTVASSGNGTGSGNSSEFQIGARAASGHASAIIDDVAVFGKALSTAEIELLYATKGNGGSVVALM